MNSEIERAFVAALTPVLTPLSVVPGLSSEIDPPDTARLIVDASADNESPVATLWRLPLTFRLDFPALVETGNPEAEIRVALSTLLIWLQDHDGVMEAFVSEQIALLPGWHLGTTRDRSEGDRLIVEVEVILGLHQI